MSIHRSLRGVDTLVGERSVLTRFERIRKLAKEGKVDPESGSAYGLPKVRTRFKVVNLKKKKAEAKEEEKEEKAAAKDAKAAKPAK